ncbi:MAG: hypothetical protein WA101_03470 [Minisyncoccia bacterium]
MFPEKIIFIGVFINLICTIWYIRGIFYSGTKPNLVSFFIWTLAPFIGVFLQLKAGAGLSTLSVFMAGFCPLLVLLFSIFNKNSYWKITRFDLICGLISLLALVLYVFTHKLGISILFAIVSDGLASIPTIKKSWNFPETETSSIFIAGLISNVLSLLIIKNWIFSIYSFSVYLIIINIIIIFSIYRKRIFKKI